MLRSEMISEPGLSILPEEISPAEGPLSIAVDLILEGHHVKGDLLFRGVPRRLVDILNALDSPFVSVRDAELFRAFSGNAAVQTSDIMHIHAGAILLAVPRSDITPQARILESVARVAAPATVVLPGFEVSGNIHVPPEVNPAAAYILATKQFIPLTSARIIPTQNASPERSEPIVLVNLARALLFAPGQDKQPCGL